MTGSESKLPSLADASWLKEGPLAHLLAVLDRDGEEARVIGGAVRDALIGQVPREIDVATTAVPAEVTRRAEAAGFKAVPTGIEHGTVTVEITVAATGRVTSAVVPTGPLAGTPAGSCVVRAVRAAVFPRFRRDTFRVSYPFRY